MKVLASVYACSPYDGSERAVGWNWIKELDKYHEITALTSHVYKNDIEDYCKKNPKVINNTRFVYVDVPHTSWHVGYRLERLYYMLWQKEAVKIAKKLAKQEHYDLVHHITYVTCVLPTYMHQVGLPFLLGPVSGGENTPSVINYPMSKKEKLIELIRTSSQVFFKVTPNFHKTMSRADMILATTEETKVMIPQKYQNKVRVFQSIGLTEEIFDPKPITKPERVPKFLVAGRMLYWKGFEMAISAFIKALENDVNAELTVLGDTENNPAYEAHRDFLKKLCGEHLNKQIHFVSKVEHSQMKSFYDGFDVLINCSLRDSGCFVVMEAMSRSLPLICVNTGGPKVNTTSESAVKIEPAPMQQMIDSIAMAVEKLARNKSLREHMGEEGRKYAIDTFLVSERTKQMNRYYDEIVRN